MLPSPSLSETKFVGNKAKGRMVKRVLQGKKLSEKRTFLTPDTYKHVCTSGGKKYSFFGKFDVLCFLVKLALRFTLLPYYRRINPSIINTPFIWNPVNWFAASTITTSTTNASVPRLKYIPHVIYVSVVTILTNNVITAVLWCVSFSIKAHFLAN